MHHHHHHHHQPSTFHLAFFVYLLSAGCRVGGVDDTCFYHCESTQCPCTCLRSEVNCADRNMSELSRFQAHGAYRRFDFTNNRMRRIAANDFNYPEFSNANVLQLGKNEISQLEERSFAGMRRLERLYLASNRIRELSDGVFAGLDKLESLYLEHNRIHVIMTRAFRPFAATLSLLDLNNNRLRSLHKHLFAGMRSLHTLDISNNLLLRLNGAALARAPVAYMLVAGNRWSCLATDLCHFRPLYNRKRNESLMFIDKDEPQCTDPNTGRRFNFFDLQLTVSDAGCGIGLSGIGIDDDDEDPLRSAESERRRTPDGDYNSSARVRSHALTILLTSIWIWLSNC